MPKTLAFLILLVSASVARATVWTNLGTDNRGITAYMDRDSIIKDGELRYYAIKFVRPAPDDHGMIYTIMKERIDCQQKTVTTLSIAAYRSDDSLIGSSNEARPTRAIAPQSNAAAMAQTLCNL